VQCARVIGKTRPVSNVCTLILYSCDVLCVIEFIMFKLLQLSIFKLMSFSNKQLHRRILPLLYNGRGNISIIFISQLVLYILCISADILKKGRVRVSIWLTFSFKPHARLKFIVTANLSVDEV
jgi:hypothetical protein